MKIVINSSTHVGWANALSAQHLRRMLGWKALAQLTHWPAVKGCAFGDVRRSLDRTYELYNFLPIRRQFSLANAAYST